MATFMHHESGVTRLDLSGTTPAAQRSKQKYVVITRGCPLKRLQEASNNPRTTLYLGGYRTQFPTYNGGERDELAIEVSGVRMCTSLQANSTVSFLADVSIGEVKSIAVTINYDTVAETGFFRVG